MGKRLIIKDVDFSENAIGKATLRWYTNLKSISSLNGNSFYPNSELNNIDFYSYGLNFSKVGYSSIYGKPINRVKLMCQNDPSAILGNLKTSSAKIAVFKISLNVDFDSLPQVSQSWSDNGTNGTVAKIEEINNDKLVFDDSNECVLELTNSITLDNSNQFISVGFINGPGGSDYTIVLPYNGVAIPVEVTTQTPALTIANQTINRGYWRSAFIPAIDFGYEGL